MSTPTPPIPSTSLADRILNTIDALLQAAGPLLPGEQLIDLFVKVAQRGVAAYENQAGQPIDPTLLKPIDPVP